MRTPAKLILFIEILILSTMVFTEKSNADDICLAKLPDSAWDSGEPTINFSENPGIQSRRTGTTAEDLLSGGSKQMTITYEYIGPNCSLRKIIKNYELIVGFKKMSDEEIMSYSKKINLWNPSEFMDSVTVFRKITTFGKAGYWSNIQINPLSNFGEMRIPLPYQLNAYSRISQFSNGCGVFKDFYSNRWLDTSIYGVEQVRILKQPCELKVSYVASEMRENLKSFQNGFFERYVTDPKNRYFDPVLTTWESSWDTNLRKLAINYKMIEVNTFSITYTIQKVTIACRKGKIEKLVTSTNPKCPKGYQQVP